MKKRTLFLAGFTSFILTSLTQVPAQLITERLQGKLPVDLQDVSGTLWQGSASSLTWQTTQLRNLQWAISFPALLKGQLAADLQAQLATGGKFAGTCGIGFTRQVQCHALTLNDIPAQSLAPYLQNFMLPELRGTFQADLEQLTLTQPLPRASGKITWQDAGTQLAPQTFGTYTADLSEGDNASQQISLNSAPNAAFNASGQVNLQTDGSYHYTLNLKPDASVGADVKQFLDAAVGTAQTDGTYHLDKQGKLNTPN